MHSNDAATLRIVLKGHAGIIESHVCHGFSVGTVQRNLSPIRLVALGAAVKKNVVVLTSVDIAILLSRLDRHRLGH